MSTGTEGLTDQYLMNTYGLRDVRMVRGEGVCLYDSEGKCYLDFLSGLGVNNLGHCHPAIVKAVSEQAAQLIHCCNLYLIEPQLRLAELLCKHSFADKAFFCNSGAEAVEGAMKLARWNAWQRGEKKRRNYIAMSGSFHGRTFGALSVSAPEKVREGFEPAVGEVRFAKFNDLADVEQLADDSVCGIIVEPVVGEGGVIPASKEFLRGLRALCDAKGIALIFDEIQCGLGRIGANFAYEYYDVVPDILTLAKGLAGGLPVGAVLARGEFAEAFVPGKHGSTFGGNPVSSAAALAYLEQLFFHNLAAQVKTLGEYFLELLRREFSSLSIVKEIRGMGLMVGIELTIPGAEIVRRCAEKGLLINCTVEKVIRMLPPFIITKDDCDRAVEILKESLEESTDGKI